MSADLLALSKQVAALTAAVEALERRLAFAEQRHTPIFTAGPGFVPPAAFQPGTTLFGVAHAANLTGAAGAVFTPFETHHVGGTRVTDPLSGRDLGPAD